MRSTHTAPSLHHRRQQYKSHGVYRHRHQNHGGNYYAGDDQNPSYPSGAGVYRAFCVHDMGLPQQMKPITSISHMQECP